MPPRPLTKPYVEVIAAGLYLLEDIAHSTLLDPALTGAMRDLRQDFPRFRAYTMTQDWKPRIDSGISRSSLSQVALATVRTLRESVYFLEQARKAGERVVGPLWMHRARRIFDRLERDIGVQVLRRQKALNTRGLYVIVDPQVASGRTTLEIAQAALRGGASVIQLRDKVQEKGLLFSEARNLKRLCEEYDALFLVNDHPDLAAVTGADGVHLGQKDLPVPEARRILSPDQLIGRSNALLEEALETQALGADYVAVGSIFATTTKDDTRPAGLETLRKVKESVFLPVVAIGGINEGNVAQVIQAGADAVAVISAVCAAPDPEAAARRLVERVRAARVRQP